MQWYWMLIITVVSAGSAGLLVFLLLRNSRKVLFDREALLKQQAKELEATLAVTRETKEKVEKELLSLAEELKANAEWYEKAKGKLNKELKDEYEKLASDPAALDAKLDSLLSE